MKTDQGFMRLDRHGLQSQVWNDGSGWRFEIRDEFGLLIVDVTGVPTRQKANRDCRCMRGYIRAKRRINPHWPLRPARATSP